MDVEVTDDGKGKHQSVRATASTGLIVHPWGHLDIDLVGYGRDEAEARHAMMMVRDDAALALAGLKRDD